MRVPAGAMLFDDRQACEGFPFVVEGTVRVSKCAPSGRELPPETRVQSSISGPEMLKRLEAVDSLCAVATCVTRW